MTAATSAIDQVIEVLGATEDGNRLAPKHLYLCQLVANAGAHAIDESVEVAFAELYASVKSGQYDAANVWFHGIEHLTKDHAGYVFWRGIRVEHYSFNAADEEAQAARALAQRCLALEANGIAVNGRTTLYPSFALLRDEHKQWLPALQSMYALKEHRNGVAALLSASATVAGSFSSRCFLWRLYSVSASSHAFRPTASLNCPGARICAMKSLMSLPPPLGVAQLLRNPTAHARPIRRIKSRNNETLRSRLMIGLAPMRR